MNKLISIIFGNLYIMYLDFLVIKYNFSCKIQALMQKPMDYTKNAKNLLKRLKLSRKIKAGKKELRERYVYPKNYRL